MLSFFRDAACPFCNLRVYELSNEYEALTANGLHVVTFCRSSDAEVQRLVARRSRPFRLVADPQMAVYGHYGIERSMLGMVHAMLRRLPRLMRGLRLGESRLPAGDPLLMPADFLIDERGFIRRAYYGRDLGDHLPMSEVHVFAAPR
jgi:peroxiredoxin Q/BCP